PRLRDVWVGDDSGKNGWLTFASLVGHGEEVCALTRLDESKLPERITVRGNLDGRPVQHDLRVENVTEGAGYLPRTWAKLEIERLLAEDAVKHKEAIVALSKAMYVMTPFTSLLVLENEAMYQQFKVDRGRKDHWANYPAPDKIPVFHEDEDGNRIDPKKAARPTPKQVRDSIVVRPSPNQNQPSSPMQDSNIATNVRVLGAIGDESAPEALPKPARPLLAEDLRTVVIKGYDPSVVAQTVEAIHRPRIEASALPEIGGIVIRPEERA